MTTDDDAPEAPTPAPAWRRAVAIAVIAFAVTAAVLVVRDLGRRDDLFPRIAPYDGWQLDLAVAGIGLLALGLIALGAWGLYRNRQLASRHTAVQTLAMVVAMWVGIGAAIGVRPGPDHLLNWAANQTASAARDRAAAAADEHRMFGDATHPPMISTGPPAPAAAAAPLLQPSDLGPDWHLQAAPVGHDWGATNPSQSPGLLSTATVPLAQEVWNGREWVHDLAVLETAQRFSSRIGAKRQERRYARTPFTSPVPTAHELVVAGSVFIELSIIRTTPGTPAQPVIGPIPSFTPITTKQIIEAAIRSANRSNA